VAAFLNLGREGGSQKRQGEGPRVAISLEEGKPTGRCASYKL